MDMKRREMMSRGRRKSAELVHAWEEAVAAYKASLEVYKEAGEKSPAFKKIYESMIAFRAEELLWFRVAEKGFDDFMHSIGSIK